jgi:pimeloyl-ACP methyl ester carboxylesterase
MRSERLYTEIDGYRFHSLHAGAGSAVVLLHGLAGSSRWWRYTLPALASTFHTHIPELIGFGRSRPAPHQPDIPTMASLLLAWMDEIGLGHAHLVGHSMGGQIAIHAATQQPERIGRLVLAAAAGIPRPLAPAEVARFLAEIVPPRAWGRLSFLPTIAFDTARAGPWVIWRAFRHLLADDVRPLLPTLAAPTLLIWGRFDPLVPLAHGRQMAELIPDARLRIIPDAGHNAMADRPERFNDLLLSFLETGDAVP